MRNKPAKYNRILSLISTATTAAILTGCQVSPSQQENSASIIKQSPSSLFTESRGVLPTENRGRRKWDGAIVGDLDGNGFQDLILTEHAYKVRIFWNEGGQFSGPQDLISGDMHGISIADLDQNGLIDILIAQGGGNGAKPKKPLHYEVTKDRKFIGGEELKHFEKGRGRSVKVLDANNDGILELFLTGFPTPEQFKKGANHFYLNDGKGDFTFNRHLPFGSRLSYRSTITDFNNDGDPDIIVFGGDNMVAIQGGKEYQFSDQTPAVFGQLKNTHDISSISQIDFDRDGDLDLILSRAEHQFEHETYFDEENKRFAFFARFQPLQVEDLTVEGDFYLENLQMAFPNFDVFVGKNKRKLEIDLKGKKSTFDWDQESDNNLTLTKADADGFPTGVCPDGLKMKDLPKQSKLGLYIGHIGNNVWRICSQTKSPTAGVIHNVQSKHQSVKDEPLPAMLLENQNGTFVDVTAKMGLSINEQTTSAVAADFDKDGWDDLLLVRYGNMAKENEQILYLNNQGKSFVRQDTHGVFSKDLGATGSGADIIDYDRDGDFDLVMANERGRWHLYTNNSEALNSNNFIGVQVSNSPSGKATAFGASVTVSACSMTTTKTVGDTSSSFAVTHNNDLLVGLGQCEKVDKITVKWTNGETLNLTAKAVNQYLSTK